MKKHSLVTQILNILFILVLFVIPPLFNTGNNFNTDTFINWSFPWVQIITGSLFLFVYIKYLYTPENDRLKTFTVKADILYSTFTIIFTLSLLFFNALIFKFLSVVIPSGSTQIPIDKPDTALTIIFCFINFIFSSIYEEVLYRAYLPEVFNKLFVVENVKSKKIFSMANEIIALLLFAFSHLYAGWLSVLNAVVAHIILRLIYKKTGNLYTNMGAHFLYNLLILFVF